MMAVNFSPYVKPLRERGHWERFTYMGKVIYIGYMAHDKDITISYCYDGKVRDTTFIQLGSSKKEMVTHLKKFFGGSTKYHVLNNELFCSWFGLDIITRDHKMPQGERGINDMYQPSWKRVDKYEPEIKKLNSYHYLRMRSMARIMATRAYDYMLAHYKVSHETIRDIGAISFRSRLSRGEGKKTLFAVKVHCHPKLAEYIFSDLKKYSPAVGSYLLDELSKWHIPRSLGVKCDYYHTRYKYFTLDMYKEMIAGIPPVVKKCRYTIPLGDNNKLDFLLPRIKTRIQWYMYGCLRNRTSHMFGDQDLDEVANKAVDITLKDWHLFKKYQHVTKAYNMKEMTHILRVIDDARRQYKEYHSNEYGIKFVPVTGSFRRMLRNSIFNHRQDIEYQKKRKLSIADGNLPMPPIELPEWIEKIRIKTVHELITAGIECEHCIGGYTYSNDTFLRDGEVCAQIYRNDLTVGQCYGIKDRITKESESLRSRLTVSLNELKELQKV